jgi:hypothetical protein
MAGEGAGKVLDMLAKLSDYIFLAGFAALDVVWIIKMIGDSKFVNIGSIVILGYYIFFTLFFVGVVLRLELLMTYCGFLKSIFPKSLFYVL